MYLLDTCTLLWLAADQDKLSKNAIQVLRSNSDSLFVSAISSFEISLKTKNNKLKLPICARDWFEEALDFHGLKEIPISGVIAALSVEMPSLHNDPCDRMIIATAILYEMKIITCDKLIRQYQEVQVVW